MSAYQSPSAFVGLTPDEVELDGTLFSSFFVHRSIINLDHSSCPPNYCLSCNCIMAATLVDLNGLGGPLAAR